MNSWFGDRNDTELLQIIPIMEKLAATNDIYSLLKLKNQVEDNYLKEEIKSRRTLYLS